MCPAAAGLACAVCRARLAASLRSLQLSARIVDNVALKRDHTTPTAQLWWLSRRGPVQQAHLAVGAFDVPTAAFCLGRWAGSLRELMLLVRGSAQAPCRLDFLVPLQQLTLLSVMTTVPAASDARVLSRLGRLRNLTWAVNVQARTQEMQVLLLPPALQNLWLYPKRTRWDLTAPQQPGLAGLEALYVRQLQPPVALLSSLGELSRLTYLRLQDSGMAELPRSLSQCTGILHLHIVSCGALGPSAEGVASLGYVLQRLPRLRSLCVPDIGLASLAPLWPPSGGPPLQLRQLQIYGNACNIPHADWLATLEVLICDWEQARPGLRGRRASA